MLMVGRLTNITSYGSELTYVEVLGGGKDRRQDNHGEKGIALPLERRRSSGPRPSTLPTLKRRKGGSYGH